MSNPNLSDRAADAGTPTSRRRRSRLVGVFVLLAALLGLTLATAAPASALGYSISYSVRNDTNQTLTFVSAHGPGPGCNIRQFNDQMCDSRYGDQSFRVSPQVIKPGEAFGVYSEIDIFSFQEKNYIRATYKIGDSNDKVVLYASEERHTCKVEASREYICEVIPVGQLRDFALRSLR